MTTIELIVVRQKLKIKSFPIVEGSILYLTLKAAFSSDWNGLGKTVYFQKGTTLISRILDEDDSIKPEDNLQLSSGDWTICIEGTSSEGKKITTDSVTLSVTEYTAPEGDTPTADELTLYEQAVAISAEARTAANSAQNAVNTLSENIAEQVSTTESKASEAASSASKAELCAEAALESQKKAETAATTSIDSHGFMSFSIDSDGCLQYEATDSMSNYTWTLVDGELIVSYD